MITEIVVVFSDEDHAQRGLCALKELQSEGSLALYGSAVLVKDSTGQVSLRDTDGGPFGMSVGGIAGGMLGLLAGPLGVAIGATSGAVAGAVHETHEGHYRSEAVEQAAEQVPLGASAVVAQVAEFGQTRLEERMRALQGLVLHEGRMEVEYQEALSNVLALGAAAEAAQDAYEAALARATSERDARLTEVRAQEAGTAQRLNLLTAFMQQQADGRLAQLRRRAEQAGPEAKPELERQVAQIGSDHHVRLARLEEAWAQAQAAVGPEEQEAALR